MVSERPRHGAVRAVVLGRLEALASRRIRSVTEVVRRPQSSIPIRSASMSTLDLTLFGPVPRMPPLSSDTATGGRLADRAPAGHARGQAHRVAAGSTSRSPLPVASIVAYVAFTLMICGAVAPAHRSPLYLAGAAGGPGGMVPAPPTRRPGCSSQCPAIWVRMLSLGAPETCDQIIVSRAALRVAHRGGNPYGFGYAESVPPGAPFPYGPLGLLIPRLVRSARRSRSWPWR